LIYVRLLNILGVPKYLFIILVFCIYNVNFTPCIFLLNDYVIDKMSRKKKKTKMLRISIITIML